MSTHETMVNNLIEAYGKISECNSPEWAVHKRNNQNELVKPSIPFVGKHYADQPKRILVYASAEVLSDYYPGSISDRPWLNDNTQAVNRHRVLFDESESTSWFFPNVHIQPMNDGTLATAVLYIASRFVEIGADKPREFYERIAIANYGKYTKETEHQENIRTGKGNYGSDTNTDYTQMSIKKARECLQESHPFLKIDLEILRPEIIILPEKLYYRDRKYFDEIANAVNAKIIGIYQMGPIPINCTIPKYYAPKDFQALHPTVKEWTAQIKRVSQKKYLSVFTYLDHILEHDLYDVE